MQVDELRKNVGMVFQRPNPFPKSIFENVAYGPVSYTHLVGTTYPMDGAFHLTVGSGRTALGIRVIFAIYFGYFTGVVLLAAGTLHDVRVLPSFVSALQATNLYSSGNSRLAAFSVTVHSRCV